MSDLMVFVLSCLLLSGCVSIGNSDLASDQTMANIQVGETTRQQVLNLLGEPDGQMKIEMGGASREWWSCLSRLRTDYDMGRPLASMQVSSVSSKTMGLPEPAKQPVHYEDRMDLG